MNGGKIQVIIGPMFSGKTTEMSRRLNRHIVKHPRESVLVIKSNLDNRFNSKTNKDKIVSRDGIIFDYPTVEVKTSLMKTLVNNISNIGNIFGGKLLIAVDEAQFFPDLTEFCDYVSSTLKIDMIVSGLNSDANRKEFGQILSGVIPIASQVDLLKAICMNDGCKEDASFTERIVSSNQTIIIGDTESYRSLCYKCWNYN